MLADTQAPIVLTQQGYQPLLPAQGAQRVYLDAAAWQRDGYAAPNVADAIDGQASAYVIYTSGSTGVPKGVCVPHCAISRLVLHSDYLQHCPGGAGLRTFPMCRLTPRPWRSGAHYLTARLRGRHPARSGVLRRGVCRPAGGGEDRRAVCHHGVVQSAGAKQQTLAGVCVGAWRAVRRRGLRSGEYSTAVIRAAAPTALARVRSHREHDVHHLVCDCGGAEGTATVPIGRPIRNTTVYVLDAELNPVGVGVIGELYTGGDGLAHGYLGRAALTAASFVPDPFSAVPGARLYRTGDRARWCADGVLDFLGRQDQQVKVRGFRLELGEIETQLQRHPAIREAAVVVRADGADEKTLVAYYVPHSGQSDLSAQVLRAYLLAHLPAYMAPAFFVALDAFPLTPNGKLDRRALPATGIHKTARARRRTYTPPHGGSNATLAAIWQDVLKREPIGIHDNFFELGGDSILSMQIASRATKAGYPLQVKDIFAYPTIHALAEHCRRTPTTVVYAPQEAITGEQVLLPIQQWFFEQGFTNAHHWNQSFLLEAPSELTEAALPPLLAALLQAHDALRLRFSPLFGVWSAHYAPAREAKVAIQAHDLRHLTEAAQVEALETLGYALKGALDLENGPLVGAALFDLGPAGKRLLLTIHHLVVDTVSWRVLLEDLEQLYQQQQQGEPFQPAGEDHAVPVLGPAAGGVCRQRGAGRGSGVLDPPRTRQRTPAALR